MKLKGINPAEQHIEKIVLGSLGVVLLGVLTLQFAFPPPGVTVANQEVKPDKAYEPVQAEAIRTLAAMNNTEPQLPDVSAQALAAAYQNALNARTVPNERMAALGPARSFGALELESSGVGGQYAMPSLPQPTSPVAASYRGTVHPSEWAASEALREVLGADQPFDLGVVTVQAFIDGQAVRTALLTDPDGDAGPARSLPPSWWSQGFEILGIQLERERLASDGSWTEATIVGGLPGRPDLLTQIQRPEAQDPVVVIDLARLAGSQAEQITKPDFYRTIAGERWQPPAARQQTGDPNREQVQRIVRQLRGVERDLQLLEDAMSNQTQETRTPPAGDPGGGGRGGRGGGGGGREVRQPSPNEDRADPRVARMERLETQIDQYVQELETLGYGTDGTKFDTGELSEDVFGKFARLFDNNKLAVWAHDLTAQGGETYRYRLRPVFNNPVYGRGQALSEEQQSLAADRTFPGPWSAWGEPVEALAEEYYFVVNAREGNRLGGGPQASVELYSFYYGYYRRGTQAVEPGDMLLAQARVPEGLRLYDLSNLDLLDELAPAAAPTDRGGEPEGRGRTGRGLPDPREIEVQERGRPGGDERGQPAPEVDPDLPGAPALTELPVVLDVFLLDIARLPGSGGQQEGALVEASNEYRAFLTPISGGTILVRNPSEEQESPLYQAVEASWRAGQRASEPVEAEVEQPGLRRQPRDDAPRAPRAPAGGGGGGGGAG